MARDIVIQPVSRIEGHAKITLHLDDEGRVQDAQFHVTQVRGFEKFCEGRPFSEMPALMARICGICPVSHLVASAKACDELLGVQIPSAAVKLRTVLTLAQVLQSHALNFFYLCAPDLLLGMDADPSTRNIVGLAASHPDIVRDGIRLRQIGQQIIEQLAGKRIHPAWVVPGGVSAPLEADRRDQLLTMLPDALDRIRRAMDWYKHTFGRYGDEIRSFGNFASLFLGLVDEAGRVEFYDGRLRVQDGEGRIIHDQLDPKQYQDYIGEAVAPWTYLKFPYFKLKGYPHGMYRVGPLARLNVADRVGTPLADQELVEFQTLQRGAVLSSFHYHYARLVEMLYAVERMEQLLRDEEILSRRVRAVAGPNNLEGIGVAEAPRGTLIHHYRIDEQGLMTWANLIIATGHNNLAMNRAVLQVARQFVDGSRLQEGMLNRVEAVIRAFDPCLSCSTHALGQMPLVIQMFAPDGTMVDEVRRG